MGQSGEGTTAGKGRFCGNMGGGGERCRTSYWGDWVEIALADH